MATLMTWSRSKPSPVVSQSTWSASCGWTVRGVRSSSFAPRVVGVHREGRGVRRRRMSCSCRRRPPVSVFSLPRFLTPARRRFSLAPQEAVCGRRRRGAALRRKARVVGWRCGARAPAGRGHGERLDGESGFVKSGGVRRCGTWRQSSPYRPKGRRARDDRAGGEHAVQVRGIYDSTGSSPRGRGTLFRSLQRPPCRPGAVHPRAGGEHRAAVSAANYVYEVRFIPARAGNTPQYTAYFVLV